MAEELPDTDVQMEANSLYREETFTDRRVGTLQILTPVNSDGTADSTRQAVYVGQTQILTPAGALPLNFELEASSLQEAVEKFGDGAKSALSDAAGGRILHHRTGQWRSWRRSTGRGITGPIVVRGSTNW